MNWLIIFLAVSGFVFYRNHLTRKKAFEIEQEDKRECAKRLAREEGYYLGYIKGLITGSKDVLSGEEALSIASRHEDENIEKGMKERAKKYVRAAMSDKRTLQAWNKWREGNHSRTEPGTKGTGDEPLNFSVEKPKPMKVDREIPLSQAPDPITNPGMEKEYQGMLHHLFGTPGKWQDKIAQAEKEYRETHQPIPQENPPKTTDKKKEIAERLKELETRRKALLSLSEKVSRRMQGEPYELTMDERDVLLELRNKISKLPDDPPA